MKKHLMILKCDILLFILRTKLFIKILLHRILKPKYQFIHDVLDFEARNHHNINDPYFRFMKHNSENDNVENNTDFEIRDQYLRLSTTRDQLALYSTVLIPQAEQSLNSSESAYSTGKLGFLDLLDSVDGFPDLLEELCGLFLHPGEI